MKSIDIFRLLLRVIGLVGLAYVCRHIFVLIHKTGSWHLGWLLRAWDKTGRWDPSDVQPLVLELLLIAFGFYLLRGAPLLVKFMYPENTNGASDHGKSAVGQSDPTKR
jgi:hypothetical protein